MKKENSIILFNENQVRRHRDEDKELRYFSVVDVIAILTNSPRPRKYWNDLKSKLLAEWSELSENIGQLKLISSDGKKYLTDVADTENLLRLIQSVPSPKAEPFKLWLAKVWYQRIEETEDPELAMERAMQTYSKKWYSREWINQRLKSIEIRKELTDERKDRGIKAWIEYAILTDEITRAWSGKSIKEYKKFKWLKKQNLRDNMSNLELVLNMLAEASTTEISKKQKPDGLEENKEVAQKGGNVAKQAKISLEKQIWDDVTTNKNYLQEIKASSMFNDLADKSDLYREDK